ncbi:helix-turn-helix transcriptional regulator [Bacillus cereus group sp. N21]|uniref:helix-turn-helix domain-containing protein n=1 Tax=Bacillus cereus group sp. N21 TaxID=2794591 RepID=UPI001A7E7AC7|nr:helix-turn-helix transcriptional regulator [Bacillus cereus group sp. N21]
MKFDLSKVCKAYDLNITELAELTGHQRKALSRVNSTKTASWKTITRIAEALNEPPHHVVEIATKDH